MKLDLGEGKVRDGYQRAHLKERALRICSGGKAKLESRVDDEAVIAVWSDNWLQKQEDPARALNEISRVCSVGATVEISVPHHLSEMANAPGNLHTITKSWLDTVEYTGRKLVLKDTIYRPSSRFQDLRSANHHVFGGNTALICSHVPGACDAVTFELACQ